jgi:hypothetical protein
MPDAYALPTLRDSFGRPAPACEHSLVVTSKYKTTSGQKINDVLKVYSPDNWTVIKGKKVSNFKTLGETTVTDINLLRQ